MSVLAFVALGDPKAQGSKRHVGGGKMIESSRDLPAWRRLIAERAQETRDGQTFVEPVRVRARFFFRRPASHYRTGQYAGELKSSAPVFRASKPDVDKLCRALLDALVIGGALRSDALVVELVAEKRYGDPCVVVEIASLSE